MQSVTLIRVEALKVVRVVRVVTRLVRVVRKGVVVLRARVNVGLRVTEGGDGGGGW
jgi:hypothetical protein